MALAPFSCSLVKPENNRCLKYTGGKRSLLSFAPISSLQTQNGRSFGVQNKSLLPVISQ